MLDRHVVEAFAVAVESNDHVGAIERFYAPDASTRENQNEPRKGRDVLAARERAVLASVAKVETRRLGPIFIDGDHSAIHWPREGHGRNRGADLARQRADRGAFLLRSRTDEGVTRGHTRFRIASGGQSASLRRYSIHEQPRQSDPHG
jgi:hypothetical protein